MVFLRSKWHSGVVESVINTQKNANQIRRRVCKWHPISFPFTFVYVSPLSFSALATTKTTPSTSSPWPSFCRYLSTKQARSTTPLHSKQPHYTREHVCLFIRQLHLIAVHRGLRKPTPRSHELCAPQPNPWAQTQPNHAHAFPIALYTPSDYIATLETRLDCIWGPFPPVTNWHQDPQNWCHGNMA